MVLKHGFDGTGYSASNTLSLKEALQTALVILNNHVFADKIAKADLEELEQETISHARDIVGDYLHQEDFIETPWYEMDFTIEELKEIEELKALKKENNNE
jgi:hypothetical protein